MSAVFIWAVGQRAGQTCALLLKCFIKFCAYLDEMSCSHKGRVDSLTSQASTHQTPNHLSSDGNPSPTHFYFPKKQYSL